MSDIYYICWFAMLFIREIQKEAHVRVVVQAEERGVQSNGEDNLIFKTGRKTGTQVHTS